jgi:hypothetical protein
MDANKSHAAAFLVSEGEVESVEDEQVMAGTRPSSFE